MFNEGKKARYLDANRADAFVRLSSLCRGGSKRKTNTGRNRNTDRVTFNSNINIRDININIRVSPLYVNSKQIRKWIKI